LTGSWLVRLLHTGGRRNQFVRDALLCRLNWQAQRAAAAAAVAEKSQERSIDEYWER